MDREKALEVLESVRKVRPGGTAMLTVSGDTFAEARHGVAVPLGDADDEKILTFTPFFDPGQR